MQVQHDDDLSDVIDLQSFARYYVLQARPSTALYCC